MKDPVRKKRTKDASRVTANGYLFTDEKRELFLEAIRNCLPVKYAADLVGVSRDAVQYHITQDHTFAAKVALARALSVKALVGLVLKDTGGAWKILKNLARDEFKDRLEVSEGPKEEIILQTSFGEEKFQI